MNLQKNISQKLSMLEKNKDSLRICIKFRTKLRIPIFVLLFLIIEDFQIKLEFTIIYLFLVQKEPKKN